MCLTLSQGWAMRCVHGLFGSRKALINCKAWLQALPECPVNACHFYDTFTLVFLFCLQSVYFPLSSRIVNIGYCGPRAVAHLDWEKKIVSTLNPEHLQESIVSEFTGSVGKNRKKTITPRLEMYNWHCYWLYQLWQWLDSLCRSQYPITYCCLNHFLAVYQDLLLNTSH